MDFLWRKVSEKEKEEIKKEAGRIMKSFAKKIESVKGNVKESVGVQTSQEDSDRVEGSVDSCKIDREIMFSNAPNKNEDSIVAERGEW